jgi:hypothetical protein
MAGDSGGWRWDGIGDGSRENPFAVNTPASFAEKMISLPENSENPIDERKRNSSGNPRKSGGFIRCATALKKQKAQGPR